MRPGELDTGQRPLTAPDPIACDRDSHLLRRSSHERPRCKRGRLPLHVGGRRVVNSWSLAETTKLSQTERPAIRHLLIAPYGCKPGCLASRKDRDHQPMVQGTAPSCPPDRAYARTQRRIRRRSTVTRVVPPATHRPAHAGAAAGHMTTTKDRAFPSIFRVPEDTATRRADPQIGRAHV